MSYQKLFDTEISSEAVKAWKAQEIKGCKRWIAKLEKRIASGTDSRHTAQELTETKERLAKFKKLHLN